MKKTTQTEQDKANGYSDIGYNAPQHTPGPWETGAMMTRVEVLPQGWRMPMLIADCHGKHSPESEAERVANARLIAAAPELLEALELHLAFLDSLNAGWLGKTTGNVGLLNDAYLKGNAALAKVKGKI